MTKVYKPCGKCGVEKRDNRPLCLPCRRKLETYRRSINAQANKKKKKLIAERGNACQKCHEVKPLIAHHILPVIDGGKNDDSNLLLVCKPCHDKIHAKRTVKKSFLPGGPL